MAYQTPITIEDALTRVHRHDLVLPAIQREFVWRPDQIAVLFDSLMRGYPIGAFLFWKVEPEQAKDFQFYDFVLNYHQKDRPHCPPLAVTPGVGVTAVLDGQQRLTALNVGLRGSHAEKEPRKWWNNPDAYPTKRLYLNVLSMAEDNEQGLVHDFRFLTDKQAERSGAGHEWFRVGDILKMKSHVEIFSYLQERDLTSNPLSFPLLGRLHSAVHVDGVVSYYEEKDQDPDKVLNIFIRTNSGGTQLSYSDLLLSIATAQWERLDARSAIHDLVDELNGTRFGFNFSKDFVLKAGLMLADVKSIAFKVTNFNRANMAVLESEWDGIARALRLTVRLVASFGFSGQSLGADSALLPIAYYLHRRGADATYLTSSGDREDRGAVHSWLVRSLLKTGVWGSGLDTVLTMLRSEIREHGGSRFPTEEVEGVLARRGRRLQLEEGEVEDLLDIRYGDRRTFALLSMLYPFVDLGNEFHVDHVYPRSQFTPRKLEKAGVPSERVDEMRDMVDRLPNLQLLEGRKNESKGGKMPGDWAAEQFSDPDGLDHFVRVHDLHELTSDVAGFEAFYALRRSRMRDRLRALVGAPGPSIDVGGAAAE